MAYSSAKAEITPAVLQWARESLDLTVEEVAAKLHRSPDTIRLWESGKDAPTLTVLDRLASYYKRPLAVFYLPERPPDPPAPEDFRRLPSGAVPRLSVKGRLAIRKAEWLQSIAIQLRHDLNLPEARLTKASLQQKPVDLASHARKLLAVTIDEQEQWDKPSTAFRAWREALGNQMVLVFQLTFPLTDARGLSLPNPKGPTLVVNSADAFQGRIFTLFHEFAHLLLRAPGVCSPDSDGEQLLPEPMAHVEQFCNEFAGEFLVPRDSLLEVVKQQRGRLRDEHVDAMARRWKVSRQVIWRRLLAARLISGQHYWNKVRALQERKGKAKPDRGFFAVPAPIRVLREKGWHFTNLVVAAHERQLITTNEMADYLGIKVRHLAGISKTLETSSGS